jgi:hypothetical protein
MSYKALHFLIIANVAAFIILFSACQLESSQAPKTTSSRFFDLKTYFQQESESLTAKNPQLRKRLEIDGRIEEQTLDSVDFSEELRLFAEADINRPAWLDKYAVDSLMQNGHLSRLTYRALKADLKTRELQIDFLDGKVSEIHIQKKFDTAIANTDQKLAYYPGKGYSIENRQKTVLQDPQVFKVEVTL